MSTAFEKCGLAFVRYTGCSTWWVGRGESSLFIHSQDRKKLSHKPLGHSSWWLFSSMGELRFSRGLLCGICQSKRSWRTKLIYPISTATVGASNRYVLSSPSSCWSPYSEICSRMSIMNSPFIDWQTRYSHPPYAPRSVMSSFSFSYLITAQCQSCATWTFEGPNTPSRNCGRSSSMPAVVCLPCLHIRSSPPCWHFPYVLKLQDLPIDQMPFTVWTVRSHITDNNTPILVQVFFCILRISCNRIIIIFLGRCRLEKFLESFP
jgi:hypothetical protein